MSSKIEIIINKSEITAGTRGASLGPDAIITAARKSESRFFSEFNIRRIADCNDLLDRPVQFTNAKRIKGLCDVFSDLSSELNDVISQGNFPLIMAGDHGSAGGTIAGIKTAFPDKRLGVIWIDAHADIHTPYTTPSGNMHGMPLATALAIDNIEQKQNEPDSEVINCWEQLKSMGGENKLNAEDLVYIAVRDTEPQEDYIINELNIRNHTVEEVRLKGVEHIAGEVLKDLNGCDILYVSFDVDSMDPEATSHGTGTPVPIGLTPDEAEAFLKAFCASPKLVALEFVEVNPCLDEKVNKMAEITFGLVKACVNVLNTNDGK